MGGVSFIPILVGLFAFSQGLISFEEEYRERKQKKSEKLTRIHRVLPTWADFKRVLPTYFRSSAIGTTIGAIPGTGGDISSFISYNEETLVKTPKSLVMVHQKVFRARSRCKLSNRRNHGAFNDLRYSR